MPETDPAGPLPPALLGEQLAALLGGPYSDADSAGAAGLAAECLRYLNHAAPRDGVTEPATVCAVASELSLMAYRLPQLLMALGEWLTAGAAAGRVADDHGRPPAELAAKVRGAFGDAAAYAGRLGVTLSLAHNLSATLHASDPDGAAA